MAEWTQDEQSALEQLLSQGKNYVEIGKELGRSSDSVRKRVNRLNENGEILPKSTAAEDPKESYEATETDNNLSITSKSARLQTIDDVLNHGQVNRDEWRVKSSKMKSWEVTVKEGTAATGFAARTIPMFGVSITLERIAPSFIINATYELAEILAKHKPITPKQKKPTPRSDLHMLEIALFDAHFGKLCWGEQTGTDYDTNIAELIYRNAIDDLLAKVEGFNIDRICYPVGNDFFHVNNWQNTTEKGTPQDHDGRFQKVYKSGFMSIVHAIDRCLEVAPVDVYWIPGNHDPATSWYLCGKLESHYRQEQRVTIDDSPPERKYVHYGVNLLGLVHGNEEKHGDLPSLMPTEMPEAWAKTTVREWHLGHFHKKKEMHYAAGDTYNSIKVKVLPSLSGTDAWHFKKGYVKTPRAAEAHLWSKDKGYVGYFNAYAREI